MLKATPELRDRLLPLARLLACKAVEKGPENVDFLKTLGKALYHSQDRENAEETLLRAFDLSLAASDLYNPQTTEVIQLLIQLYESWGKPEQADKWRAKLPQKADAKEKLIAIDLSLLPKCLGPVPPVYLGQCARTNQADSVGYSLSA
jgi:tetratricopeptide (TPR) repeat protein